MSDFDRIKRHAERSRTERDELYAVLDAGMVATLATVVDGLPLAVPMLYARVGDRVLLHGSTGAGSLRQVAAGAPAALSVAMIDGVVVADNLFNSSANYRSAVVRGTLTAVPAEEASAALDALSERLIPGRGVEVAPHSRKELVATLAVALPILDGHWTVKVRTGGPGEPDVDPDAWAGVVPMHTVYGDPIPASWVAEGTPIPASVSRLRMNAGDRAP